jgi:thiosulfate reductase cytochrome b subunit
MSNAIVFSRFERFWHWSQAALVLALGVTGFTVHGSTRILDWGTAATAHTWLAWALMILWAFALFWHLITGEWRQYAPTTEGLGAVARYYLIGIFQPGVHHPYRKRRIAKHNPMQRLAYLFLDLVIIPVLWLSGLVYMYREDLAGVIGAAPSLATVAVVHVAAAFLMLTFVIAHVYMAFTGKPWWDYLVSMISGRAEVVD